MPLLTKTAVFQINPFCDSTRSHFLYKIFYFHLFHVSFNQLDFHVSEHGSRLECKSNFQLLTSLVVCTMKCLSRPPQSTESTVCFSQFLSVSRTKKSPSMRKRRTTSSLGRTPWNHSSSTNDLIEDPSCEHERWKRKNTRDLRTTIMGYAQQIQMATTLKVYKRRSQEWLRFHIHIILGTWLWQREEHRYWPIFSPVTSKWHFRSKVEDWVGIYVGWDV